MLSAHADDYFKAYVNGILTLDQGGWSSVYSATISPSLLNYCQHNSLVIVGKNAGFSFSAAALTYQVIAS